MRRSTVLVTGAAGFIGSHLVERLITDGHRVVGLDDLSTGRPDNLLAASEDSRFDLVQGSVLDRALMMSLTRGTTTVFHLASHVGAAYVERHPEDTLVNAVNGAQAVLSAVAERRIPLFFASSSEVYGNSAVLPLVETADLVVGPPATPRASYALAKGSVELLVAGYVHSGGMAVIGRLFNTIGPRQSPAYGSVVPVFLDRALAGLPLVVEGDGEQTRCFTAVGDVVTAVCALMSGDAANGATVNIGSTEETTIAELARLVLALTGSPSPVRHTPYVAAHGPGTRDVRRRVPDTAQLRRLTGSGCETPLEHTLREMLRERGVTAATPPRTPLAGGVGS